MPWDGSKGGILAFNVENNISMHADIDVSEKGFRSGAAMKNTVITMNQTDYYYNAISNNGGQKGEGISVISDDKDYGRDALANGGGGGNAHNCGGGGRQWRWRRNRR